MKTLLSLFFAILVLTSCNKEPQGDLTGDEKMIGRLMLRDTLLQNDPGTGLASKKVYIKNAAQNGTDTYLFSVMTDADGYFTFSNLKKNENYTVSYQETVDGVIYKGISTSSTPTNSLAVNAYIATSEQNGLVITAMAGDDILKEAEICVFADTTSAGYQSGNCEGSSYQLKTDANGKTKLFGINSGTYYLLAKKTIDGKMYSTKKTVSVSKNVIKTELKLLAPVPGTSITFTVTDNSGDLVAEADLCIFAKAESPGYISGVCEGSSYQLKTDAQGKAKLPGIPVATYFVLCNKMIGQVPFTGNTTATVVKGNVNVALSLNPANGIRFETRDQSGESIGNVDICVFTSKVLFDKDTCDGSNFQLNTGQTGITTKYRLAKKTYYVFSTATFGKEIWTAKREVIVGDKLETCILELKKK